jgi:hypothetical protein
METTDKERDARALLQYQQELETNIERIVREYELEHKGPIELDLSFVDGEGGAEVDEALQSRIERMVDAFQRKPAVQQSGVAVHKVTAMDSDEDGRIVVRVQYDYADEA